jgi:hypothetical protein
MKRRAAVLTPPGRLQFTGYPMAGPSETQDPPDRDPDYEERYLAGIVWFNRGYYFEAHEVWEDLWHHCGAADRRFYQSLIQAAVALYHWGNGNRAGASRLFESGRRYMQPYCPCYRGLDVDRFWERVGAALAQEPNPPAPFPRREGGGALAVGSPPRVGEGLGERLPVIALDPPPYAWPDPHPDPDPDGARHD